MGCDIHAHLEIKIRGYGWEHYSTSNIGRNYNLFAKMADVRNDGSILPISYPRGVPEDISAVTKIEYEGWGLDAHSASWLDSKEIRDVMHFHIKNVCGVPDHIPEEQAHKYVSKSGPTITSAYVIHDQWGYLFGYYCCDFNECRDEFPSEVEDIRLVFWFDN